VSHLRVFGCKAFAYDPDEKRTKFESNSMPCVFLGYYEGTKAYPVIPSFHNLVKSLESMSTKDVDLQFIVASVLHEVSKRKECESSETIALVNKTHNQTRNFVSIVRNSDIL